MQKERMIDMPSSEKQNISGTKNKIDKLKSNVKELKNRKETKRLIIEAIDKFKGQMSKELLTGICGENQGEFNGSKYFKYNTSMKKVFDKCFNEELRKIPKIRDWGEKIEKEIDVAQPDNKSIWRHIDEETHEPKSDVVRRAQGNYFFLLDERGEKFHEIFSADNRKKDKIKNLFNFSAVDSRDVIKKLKELNNAVNLNDYKRKVEFKKNIDGSPI